MGNVLESDYSTSETEDLTNGAIPARIQEERSQGDGRESDDAMEPSIQSDTHAGLQKPAVEGIGSRQLGSTYDLKTTVKHKEVQKESPRQLPPKGQLIPLKPIKLPESNSYPHFPHNDFPINKQRDPKFVPYEPYPGAVRPMTETIILTRHSRKPSNASSASGSSIVGVAQSQVIQSQSTHQPSGINTCENEASMLSYINHYKNQAHSVTLTKERLKIAEKDIMDLQNENARLKKLMVDSMAGCVTSSSPSKEAGVDNLNDEIEVWRSKFLSSCILVEQLSKENHDMKTQISSAAHLFREIKNTAGLTPDLYDQINYWLNRNAFGISQIDFNYKSSHAESNSNNYDLSPYQPSPKS